MSNYAEGAPAVGARRANPMGAYVTLAGVALFTIAVFLDWLSNDAGDAAQANGQSVSGLLLQLDDFNVSLRDASGWYRTFARTPQLKVTKTDPLAAHRALLETITDKNMHDVVAYLETFK